jgi:adenine C2-methylase RlmN of 23S rRNA A2503 and tRNA A37
MGRKEFAMPDVVEKVMQTYSMMKSVNDEKLEETREILLDFLSKRPGTDEHTAAVEALTFLRNLKT